MPAERVQVFSGAQFSIYPMTGDFVPVILGALDAYRDMMRRETDDLSTLLVGPQEAVAHPVRDVFVLAGRSGAHVVLTATLSRGCLGESDDPICAAPAIGDIASQADLVAAAVARFRPPAPSGVPVAAQILQYPRGATSHISGIGACIDFPKQVGL